MPVIVWYSAFIPQLNLEDFDPRASLAPDIEVIDLHNKGSGLGFGIVGVRDIGIVVKTIVPGGAAEEVCILTVFTFVNISVLNNL